MKLVVNVTQDDIDTGKRNNPKQCAIAKAVHREFSQAYWVDVSSCYDPQSGSWWSCHILGKKGSLSFDLNTQAKQFAIDFDAGKAVQPIQLEIEVG